MANESFQRTWSELTKQERNALRAILTVNDIKTAEQVGTWTDDHIVCVGAKINGIEFGFWWCGSEMVGDLEYANESPKAKAKVLESLLYLIEIEEDDELLKEDQA